MSDVPQVVVDADLTRFWHNGIADLVNAAQALANGFQGPVALSLANQIVNYGGVYAAAQVSRFGPLVVMSGLITYNGLNWTPNSGTLATVPAGYRPRTGSSPAGGKVITSQLTSAAANASARIDITTDGLVQFVYINGGTAVAWPTGGWMTLQGWWIGE